MGESYRGLTVRIGGDATGLVKALHEVSSAANATQSQIRRISKGLSASPESTELLNQRLRRTGELGQDVAARIRELGSWQRRLKAEGVDRLAASMDNAQYASALAQRRYNAVDTELERMNRRFLSDAKSAGRLTSELEAMDNAQRNAALHSMGVVGDADYSEYRRLSTFHADFQRQLEDTRRAAQYEDLGVEMASQRAEADRLRRSLVEARASSDAGIPAGMREARAAIARTDEAAEGLGRELEAVEDGLRLDPSSGDLMVRKVKNLSDQLGIARERSRQLNEAISALKGATGIDEVKGATSELDAEARRCADSWSTVKMRLESAKGELAELSSKMQEVAAKKPYDGQADDLRRLRSQLDATEAKVSSLSREEREAGRALDTANARRELRELSVQAEAAEAKVAGLKGQMRDMGSISKTGNLKSFATSMSATVSAGIGVVAYKAVDSAETIDGAFRDMKKTVDGTDADFARLRESALEFASTHPVSADTILEIEALGGQLGIAVGELENFGEVVSNLDIATDMDAESIATAIGQLSNVMHWGEGDVNRFGDALVRLGNNMPTQESSIVNITKRIGAAASMYGFSTAQTLAWATAIASTGQNCEAAGTAISNTMSMMEQAVAGGGEALEGWAAVAGVSAEEFARSWNTDPSGTFRQFIDGLAEIERNGGSADVALTGLGINGVRQKQALKGLTQTLDVLDESLTLATGAWERGGDAANEASQKSEGFSGAIKIMRNNVDEFAMALGEAALPFVRSFTDAVRAATDAFQSLPPEAQTAIVAVAGIAALVGPMALFGSAMREVGSFVRGVGSAARGAAAATKALGGASALARGSVAGLAVGAIALLASKAYEAWQRESRLAEATDGLRDAVSRADLSKAAEDMGAVGDASSEAAWSVREARDAVDALAQSQANLASEIAGRHDGLEADASMLNYWGGVIGDLAGRSDLTAEEVERLKLAVEEVNDACGTAYSVESMDGVFQVVSDGAAVAKESVLDLIETMKQQAAFEVYKEDYKDSIKAQLEAQKAYDEVLAARDEAVSRMASSKESGDWLGEIGAYSEMVGLNKALEESKELLDAATEAMVRSEESYISSGTAIAGTTGNVEAYVAANAVLYDALQQAGISVGEFAAALEQTGIDTASLGAVTAEQAQAVASSWDGTAASIVQALVGATGASEEQLAALSSAISSQGEGALAELSELAVGLEESGNTAAASYVRAFAETMAANAPDTSAAAQANVDEAQAVAEAGEEPFAQEGGEYGEGYVDELSDWEDDAGAAADEIGAAADSGAASWNDEAYATGAAYGQGYVNGMLSTLPAVRSAASQLGYAAVESTRAAGEVHSPSRVMRRTGRQFGMGHVLGLRDMERDVELEARRYAEITARHASMASSVSGDHGGSVSAARAYPQLTQAQVFDAVSAALAGAGVERGVGVYIDGRELARSQARLNDTQLGRIEARRRR